MNFNVDENPRASAIDQVQSIPTLIVQRGPLLVGRMAGALPKADLDALSTATSSSALLKPDGRRGRAGPRRGRQEVAAPVPTLATVPETRT